MFIWRHHCAAPDELAQHIYYVIITSNDAVTSFWRNDDIFIGTRRNNNVVITSKRRRRLFLKCTAPVCSCTAPAIKELSVAPNINVTVFIKMSVYCPKVSSWKRKYLILGRHFHKWSQIILKWKVPITLPTHTITTIEQWTTYFPNFSTSIQMIVHIHMPTHIHSAYSTFNFKPQQQISLW